MKSHLSIIPSGSWTAESFYRKTLPMFICGLPLKKCFSYFLSYSVIIRLTFHIKIFDSFHISFCFFQQYSFFCLGTSTFSALFFEEAEFNRNICFCNINFGYFCWNLLLYRFDLGPVFSSLAIHIYFCTMTIVFVWLWLSCIVYSCI